MAKMGVVVTKGRNHKQILANPTLFQAFGGQISSEGVTATNSKKIIPAGTPVGGQDFYEDEMAVLKVSNDENAIGVLLHECDVTEGTQNATVLVFGFVNENRLDTDLEISADAKTALSGKVTFVKRNL
ncbi:hypothetical protein [Enterococcus sp.]|uniref:hypothetical protein n=1 Tax=Enterococcus sp. TaxID=35783 RepID=UPI00289FCD90|nr:hypothetical protein [Enterococcus sp.]